MRKYIKNNSQLKPWSELSKKEQLDLRLAYQEELDNLPNTCSMDEKMARFTSWLEKQGVSFSIDDLK